VNFVDQADAVRAKEDVLNRLGGNIGMHNGQTVRIGFGKADSPPATPPLTLMPYSHGMSISEETSPLPTSSSTGLAYLCDGVSTPSDGGKCTGTVFDEMDLGLEFEDTGEVGCQR